MLRVYVCAAALIPPPNRWTLGWFPILPMGHGHVSHHIPGSELVTLFPGGVPGGARWVPDRHTSVLRVILSDAN